MMRIAKWGHSLAMRLRASIVEVLGLREGDEPRVADNSISVASKPRANKLLARLRAYRDRLPADFKFDRDEANGR